MRISDWSSDLCSSDLLGAAADGIAPGIGLAIVVKAVRGVRRRELVVEPGISAAARHIEESAPARRVAGTQASGRLIIGFAAHRVDRGGGRKRQEERREGKEYVRACRYRWWPWQ